MFENFSIIQSLKGVGEKCNFAPATDHVLDSTFARLATDHVLDSTYYLKSSLINCLRLWFFRRVERTPQRRVVYERGAPWGENAKRYSQPLTAKRTEKKFNPNRKRGLLSYLYSIIKKATKKIENLFCSLPDSANVPLHCCGQVGKNALRLLFDFKLKHINYVY